MDDDIGILFEHTHTHTHTHSRQRLSVGPATVWRGSVGRASRHIAYVSVALPARTRATSSSSSSSLLCWIDQEESVAWQPVIAASQN